MLDSFLSDLGRNSVLTFSLFVSNFVEEESQTAPGRLLVGDDRRNAGELARLDQGDGAIHVVPAVQGNRNHTFTRVILVKQNEATTARQRLFLK